MSTGHIIYGHIETEEEVKLKDMIKTIARSLYGEHLKDINFITKEEYENR